MGFEISGLACLPTLHLMLIAAAGATSQSSCRWLADKRVEPAHLHPS